MADIDSSDESETSETTEEDSSDSESESDDEPIGLSPSTIKKVSTKLKPVIIPSLCNVSDQINNLTKDFNDMKIYMAQSVPKEQTLNPYAQPHQSEMQIQGSPATYPNNQPLGSNHTQGPNMSASTTICWFCDKTGAHNVGMKNCPDAQAMVHQGIIKYSIEGRLVKMDDTQLPCGMPGKGGIKQAIVDDLKCIRDKSSHQ
jgi:hypothetical protein